MWECLAHVCVVPRTCVMCAMHVSVPRMCLCHACARMCTLPCMRMLCAAGLADSNAPAPLLCHRARFTGHLALCDPCTCMHLHTHALAHSCTCTRMHLRIHALAHACTCAFMHLHMHALAHSCTCTRHALAHGMHLRIHALAHSCTCIYMHLGIHALAHACTCTRMHLHMHALHLHAHP